MRAAGIDEAALRQRCADCSKGLTFDEWTRGIIRCGACKAVAHSTGTTTYSRGGIVTRGRRAQARSARRPALDDEGAAIERLLDEIPDDLIDEIVASLELEAAKMRAEPPAAQSPLVEVLDDLGFGESKREFHWAAWGFAAGFGANLAIAKYAQLSTGAPMADFIGPLILGGAVAGTTCGLIGWGLAKLREPS